MSSKNTVISITTTLLVIVLFCLLICGCGRSSRNTTMDDYNTRIKKLSKTDPALLQYSETNEYKINMDQVRGIAVDEHDNILVVGDRSILPFTSSGMSRSTILMEYAPYAIAINDEGNMFVAMQDHVRMFDSLGMNKVVWSSQGLSARFCSISCNGTNVYVGDAGNKVVLHYNSDGRLLNKIGKGTFIVPSRHLDVYASDNGVWAVNPGKHTISHYDSSGVSSKAWGTGSADIKGFSGCCNPTDIALTKDGFFVTSEKGIPRVKLYDPKGIFVCIIAPPEAFNTNVDSLDLAVDSKGRVLVLDATKKSIRVFERKGKSTK